MLFLCGVGEQLILELGEFSMDKGMIDEVVGDKGRRGVGVNMEKGDARGEVGLDVFLEVVVFKASDAEFSPVDSFLKTLLVLVDELKIGMNSNICLSKSL